jgi:hypothetical protein
MPSFFRIDHDCAKALAAATADGSLHQIMGDVLPKLRAGDFVLAARFDEAQRVGHVGAAGKVMVDWGRVQIGWSDASFDLRPSPQGIQFWRKSTFEFADSVARRYGLAQTCAGLFVGPVLATAVAGLSEPGRAGQPMSGVCDRAGYVYVLSSMYGYKIGKSRQLQERVRMFGVKLPFAFQVLMATWVEDCTSEESRLHRMFANMRLEGEWFKLDAQDLEFLRKELGCDEIPLGACKAPVSLDGGDVSDTSGPLPTSTIGDEHGESNSSDRARKPLVHLAGSEALGPSVPVRLPSASSGRSAAEWPFPTGLCPNGPSGAVPTANAAQNMPLNPAAPWPFPTGQSLNRSSGHIPAENVAIKAPLNPDAPWPFPTGLRPNPSVVSNPASKSAVVLPFRRKPAAGQ